jgi:hypothetical protein
VDSVCKAEEKHLYISVEVGMEKKRRKKCFDLLISARKKSDPEEAIQRERTKPKRKEKKFYGKTIK